MYSPVKSQLQPPPEERPIHLDTLAKYWYFRYLMVTEMYMVEHWERIVMHIIFAVIFLGFWIFNYKVVLYGISSLNQNARRSLAETAI